MKKIGNLFILYTVVAICSLILSDTGYIDAGARCPHNSSFASISAEDRIQSKSALIESIYLDIHVAPSLVKNQVDDSFAYIKSVETIFCNHTLVELSHFQCIVSKLQKIDVIFPFHYFW